MLYYLGKGTKLNKEECKEYKTKDGAERAWEKAVKAGDADISVWDENGVLVAGMTDDVPEGALEENPDGTVNVYDEDGNKVGTIPKDEAEALANVGGEDEHDDEEGQQEEKENASEFDTEKVIVPEKKTKVTVICEGSLNLRRSASWDAGNICGRGIILVLIANIFFIQRMAKDFFIAITMTAIGLLLWNRLELTVHHIVPGIPVFPCYRKLVFRIQQSRKLWGTPVL